MSKISIQAGQEPLAQITLASTATDRAPAPRTREESDLVSIMADAVKAETLDALARSVVALCSFVYSVPVAAWLTKPSGARLGLVAARGVGDGGRRALRSRLNTIERGGLASADGRTSVLRSFRTALSLKDCDMVVVGPCLLMVGAPLSAPLRRRIGVLLEEGIERVARLTLVDQRINELDHALAWAAHELRRPVSVSMIVLDTISGRLNDAENTDLVARSQAELRRLTSMLEGLMTFAGGGTSLPLQPADLYPIVRDVVESTMPGRDRIALMQRQPAVARVDEDYLRLALANVIENALTYSEGTIEVSIGLNHGSALLSVKDYGGGVSPDERVDIFDPFVKGAVGGSRRGGNGLGLYIAKKVVEAHGGKIWAESRSDGATFHIELPEAVAA